MRIAFCSDEPTPVHEIIRAFLEALGHEVVAFGSVKTGREESWAAVAEEAALAVASGDCEEGIFCCWTGTGISITANKVGGIRAALCGDPGTARGARVWNHANIICLSNRTLSGDMAQEILTAWFDQSPRKEGAEGVAELMAIDKKHRR